MINALDAELEEQKSPRNRQVYKVASCVRISYQDGVYVFKSKIIVEEGSDPHFAEGIPLEFRTSSTKYQCEAIEFDYISATLFFSSKKEVRSGYDSRVVLDASFNTLALKERIKEIKEKGIRMNTPLYKFLSGTTRNLSKVRHSEYPKFLETPTNNPLDDSQLEAFKAAIDEDITFIWGPPGTGKSFTLASIILALYCMDKERTAVCCLSNVAVDQLLSKVVEIIDMRFSDIKPGEFYRAGRSQDKLILQKKYLLPEDEETDDLRYEILNLSKKIDKFKEKNEQFTDKAIKIKVKLNEIREQLKKHTDYLINHARVIFSTISNFVINENLKYGNFDNLIVDEASMLAQPQLIALARNVGKRIILVGDFQQLSPITTAGVQILKDSVFKMCGIDITHADHPALHQLLNQRRSNHVLVDIINHAFYLDRLNAVNKKNHPIVNSAPFNENVVGMKSIRNAVVRFTKGGTRQNETNAQAVMELLSIYSLQNGKDFSIGVITPYKGQVALLKHLFMNNLNFSEDFRKKVKIGTVHTFQGSECDVIIFDIVDCMKFDTGKDLYWGRIFRDEDGEQLLNVAISRARHKLIIVCDPDFLDKSHGNVISTKSRSIFNKLLKYKSTTEMVN